LIESAILVAAFRLALWFLPFRTTRRAAAFIQRVPRPVGQDLHRIRWAVETVGRRVPRAGCLALALAAHVLLRRSQHPAEIRIGVSRDSAGDLIAHAWVECSGNVVVGGREKAEYQVATGAGRVVG
jgi:hypothetical protein